MISTRRRQPRAATSIMISASPPLSVSSGRMRTLNPATKASAASKNRLTTLVVGGGTGAVAKGALRNVGGAPLRGGGCCGAGWARKACDQQTIIHHSRPKYASTKPFSRPEVAKSRAGGTAM